MLTVAGQECGGPGAYSRIATTHPSRREEALCPVAPRTTIRHVPRRQWEPTDTLASARRPLLVVERRGTNRLSPRTQFGQQPLRPLTRVVANELVCLNLQVAKSLFVPAGGEYLARTPVPRDRNLKSQLREQVWNARVEYP